MSGAAQQSTPDQAQRKAPDSMFQLDNAVPIGGKQAPPCCMVIFGAAGDLTQRKLIPALYNLARQRLLPSGFAVLGFARREYDDDGFRGYLEQELKDHAGDKYDPNVWKWLSERIHYVTGNFDDDASYTKISERLAEIEKTHGTRGNVLFYLATSPDFFSICARQLQAAKLTQETDGKWRRVVIEKPFGRDLKTARELNVQLQSVLSESQIYRIDHYLGKETVQNIMVFRFANGIFEPIWNRRYIDHVQITVAETLGVEKRGGYYDNSGALRDMVPNHIFQLISLVAMEPPVSFQADAVRDEQSKVLRAIQPMAPEDVLTRTVRGQYAAGEVDGRMMSEYRGEPNVAKNSATETFVAMKLGIDNWRWTDVPFYLRVGKALAARTTEIAIQFKRPPFVLFRDTPVDKLAPNTLVLHIQPDEGISLTFGAKVPGATLRLGSVDMDFDYSEHFGAQPATGYERLLFDGMQGDQTLFQRADMLEASWCAVNPVLDVWSALPPRKFPNYHAGTSGPREADQLLERDGRAWRPIGKPTS